MAKLTLNKLGLKTKNDTIDVIINNEVTIQTKTYLPIDEKAELIKFVIDKSIDENTGCFSPVRIEVFYNLAIVKWYCGISFTEKQMEDPGKTYDILRSNNVFAQLENVCPDLDELRFLLFDTIEDIQRYNNSFAGVLNIATSESEGLNENIQNILEQIKNKEGIETLSAIKDMVGTD